MPGLEKITIWQKNDEFSPVHQLMKTLIEDFDTQFYICASCENTMNWTRQNS